MNKHIDHANDMTLMRKSKLNSHVQLELLVLDCFNVEADGRDSVHHLVQNGGLASSVKTQHQYSSPFSLAAAQLMKRDMKRLC